MALLGAMTGPLPVFAQGDLFEGRGDEPEAKPPGETLPTEPGETPPTEPGETPDPPEPTGSTDNPDDRSGAGQGDRAAAQSLARVGKGLMELGQYEEACAKLEQSLDASPDGRVSLLLGECYESMGRLASAWATYRQGAAIFRAKGSSEAEVSGARALALEPKVPKLTLVAQQPIPGMRVLRDDTRFGVGIFGVPVAVDPGTHRIEVAADGYVPWSTDVSLKPSERRTIEIPALEREEKKSEAVLYSTGRGPLFYAGVITTGAGAAGIAVGALLAVSASRDVRTAESDSNLCGADRLCTSDGLDLINRADNKAIGATVALSVGAAAVAAGFVMVLIDPAVSSTTEVGVLPLPGDGVLPGGGAVTATLRF